MLNTGKESGIVLKDSQRVLFFLGKKPHENEHDRINIHGHSSRRGITSQMTPFTEDRCDKKTTENSPSRHPYDYDAMMTACVESRPPLPSQGLGAGETLFPRYCLTLAGLKGSGSGEAGGGMRGRGLR